ncbi:Flp pilus assembly protein CpaB [Agromyces albus]|uniref:Flp pilus assembly protein CpaB n=1 Tax=Agromyces albus TaxID=205332 RepID=UPI00278B5A10|nr:Flp pilus assembly protein CpaB [Agromyces albus]MDQ0573785.1 hypothetical protein [Agromyces albus]
MKTRVIGAIVALLLASVGAFVLILYVRGADARAAEGAELVDTYIVQETIPKGTPGESVAEFITADTVPERNLADGAVTDLEELIGLVAGADILPGEQLLEARFLDPLDLAAKGEVTVPEGMHLLSFTLPADRVVGGEVKAGDFIGMVGTVDPGEPEGQEEVINPTTQFTFNHVLVTKVQGVAVPSEGSDEAAAQDPTGAIMLTIALSTHDVERWVWFAEGESSNYANMWLTLQTESTDTSGSVRVDSGNVWP